MDKDLSPQEEILMLTLENRKLKQQLREAYALYETASVYYVVYKHATDGTLFYGVFEMLELAKQCQALHRDSIIYEHMAK